MNFQLYNDNCFSIFPLLEKQSIDLILTDLPYGTLKNTKWDKEEFPLDLMWQNILPLMKPNSNIIFFGSTLFTAKLMLSNHKLFKEHLIWNKNKGANILQAKKQHLKIHEDILVFNNGKIKYFPIMTKGKFRKKGGGKLGDYNISAQENYNDLYYPKSILNFSNVNQKDKIHITQKPVDLLEYLIKTYSNENETILDFCAGSMSTVIAALQTNRKVIAIEKDQEIFEKGSQRVKNYYFNLYNK